MGTKAPQPPPYDEAPSPDGVVVPPKRRFVIMPACNHDPIRGPIHLVATPPYSDKPTPLPEGPAYLRCAHCGELMGMIEAVGGTLGTR